MPEGGRFVFPLLVVRLQAHSVRTLTVPVTTKPSLSLFLVFVVEHVLVTSYWCCCTRQLRLLSWTQVPGLDNANGVSDKKSSCTFRGFVSVSGPTQGMGGST